MEKIIPYYLILINLLAFILMYTDKRKAIKRHYRIPEQVLLGCAFLGGAFGAFLGMRMFRHKTHHAKFTIGIPLAITSTSVILYLYYAL